MVDLNNTSQVHGLSFTEHSDMISLFTNTSKQSSDHSIGIFRDIADTGRCLNFRNIPISAV